MTWFLLLTAIVAEVVATTALRASAGFSRFGPWLVVVAGYLIAFALLAAVVGRIDVGIAHAV